MIRELIKDHSPHYFVCESVSQFKQFLDMSIKEGIQFYYYDEKGERFNQHNMDLLLSKYDIMRNSLLNDHSNNSISIIVYYSFGKMQLDLSYNFGEGTSLTQTFRDQKLNTLL